ncbi:sulfur carrier protein ThiS [candidate division WOR-3 bacterium]|nr:sulfur carrier protein ThiS [candidate division WOR-3 bacterium]
MNIKLNKKDFIVERDELSLSELLKIVAPRHPIAAVRINGKFVKKENYPCSFLNENDRVVIVYMLGGG